MRECNKCQDLLFRCKHNVGGRKALARNNKRAVNYYRSLSTKTKKYKGLREAIEQAG